MTRPRIKEKRNPARVLREILSGLISSFFTVDSSIIIIIFVVVIIIIDLRHSNSVFVLIVCLTVDALRSPSLYEPRFGTDEALRSGPTAITQRGRQHTKQETITALCSLGWRFERGARAILNRIIK